MRLSTDGVCIKLLTRWFPSVLKDHHDRPARDLRSLAPRRLPPVLAVEIPLPWRPTATRRGSARADQADEHGKSTVRCAARPWLNLRICSALRWASTMRLPSQTSMLFSQEKPVVGLNMVQC